jgi:hypothetical protein
MNKTIKTRKNKGKKKNDDNKKNKNTGRAKYSKSCLTNKLPNMTYLLQKRGILKGEKKSS